MKELEKKDAAEKANLHPRNVHRARYDFAALLTTAPELSPFVRKSPLGDDTIDFADPEAVKALNRALLLHHYGIKNWDIPKGYLCPPVPGRADYLHYVADLLAGADGPPTGTATRILDIGVGANCVFPIIGRHVYDWTFVGSDIDPLSVSAAQHIVAYNASLKDNVSIRLQTHKNSIFHGIWQEKERFDATICNPPFHASQADADAKTARKLRNLGKEKGKQLQRNFGGQNAELFVSGGELAFVSRIIRESVAFGANCRWFTSVVSDADNIAPLERILAGLHPHEVRVIPTQQGQKTSRILAWTFLHPRQHVAWRKRRMRQEAE